MTEQQQNPLGKGYVHVYTGNGKGKTTAALGLAFRAMGTGLRTYIGQFMKGQKYSELQAARMVPDYITIEQYGKDTFVPVRFPPQQEHVEMAQAGLEKGRQALLSGRYNIIVLDEIVTALHYNLITLDDILGLIQQKPEGIELVLTGRYAPKELIEVADVVTDMIQIKHYYTQKVPARQGIER